MRMDEPTLVQGHITITHPELSLLRHAGVIELGIELGECGAPLHGAHIHR